MLPRPPLSPVTVTVSASFRDCLWLLRGSRVVAPSQATTRSACPTRCRSFKGSNSFTLGVRCAVVSLSHSRARFPQTYNSAADRLALVPASGKRAEGLVFEVRLDRTAAAAADMITVDLKVALS